MLTWNRYGKSRVRLVKVRRTREPHELVDLTEQVISLESLAARVVTLGSAQQQLTEIAKALAQDARIIVMDEPTSSLCEREGKRLDVHRSFPGQNES